MNLGLLSRASLLCVLISIAALAGAIVPGFNTVSDGRNDDGTYITGGCTNPSAGGTCAGTPVSIGFTANFFGVSFNSVYVNTNGNVTFDSPLSTFTPFDLTSTNRQIIAPFFGDVDTRNPASGITAFGTGTFAGRDAFGVSWIDVGYYGNRADKLNSFQLILVDRSDVGAGDFDIIFNYDKIQWETGDASGGQGGLGGSSARAGWANGNSGAQNSFELPGSAVDGALLDSNLGIGLIYNRLNSTEDGRYIFFARNGQVIGETPEPGTTLLLGVPLFALLAARYRRRTTSAK